ncbi:serine/threonine-protein kinase 31-like isoform X7 [Leucoraja erinacea]|uniref:serine/threonine-protein kinase 31-like isoform X7 n=1 Tax=Leucoraja erinaceus TaxID=7782 RepID=UPI002455A545|nr:serine/threonine-protein kinase 31-like isoform X7 [Leucoraja erinacea]
MQIIKMDDGKQVNGSESKVVKVEDVMGSHIEDPVTFWGQNIELIQDLLKVSTALTEICPFAAKVFGDPVPEKIYGGLYSEDQCWYRCKLIKMMTNEKCLMTYVDYGNSETLKKPCIVELPEDLQRPGLASKFRLWGLQVPPKQDVTPFDQGRRFLASLINDKIIRINHRDTAHDGTFLVEAESDALNIGQEVADKGFAEKYNVVPIYNLERVKSTAATLINGSKAEVVQGLSNGSQKVKNILDSKNDYLGIKTKGRMKSIQHRSRDIKMDGKNALVHALEKKSLTHCCSGQMQDMIKIQHDQRLLEDQNENLRTKNVSYLQNCQLLERQLKQQQLELKKMEEELKQHQKAELKFTDDLKHAVETKLGCLAEKIEKLKQFRSELNENRFGDDLSDAMKVITEGSLQTPQSMKSLENIWNEYDLAQEALRKCKSLEDVHALIDKRNELRNALYAAADEFTSEIDTLSIRDRVNVLKIFDLNSRASSPSIGDSKSVDEMLDEAERDVCRELDISTTVGNHTIMQKCELDKKIIHGAFNEVMQKINQEHSLLLIIENRYADSVQFKKQAGQWLNTYPSVGNLLSIKRSVKNLKAQLRWKLVEKNNIEDLDNYDDLKVQKMKEEIQKLRDNIYEEICCEKEEYERLDNIVQRWFPELPLLHPEAAIKSYMQSAGLLTESLERDLFDPEPMRELSSKRSLVCSEVKSKRILLKGYSVDFATEANMIERAAAYHRAWSVLKENSGLLPILYLFACKSEPVAYVMLPFYPGCSLKTVQDTNPLNSAEVIKVMRGVATGLQTLHSSNIVHGALHPHNVFAVNRERGIVGDFDFTKSADQRNIVGWMVADKVNLIAPEVRSGQSATLASDVFAFGHLLLWLNFPKNDFAAKPDGTVDFSELSMDPKLWSLVSRLTCFSPVDRLEVDQLIKDGYFLAI